MPVEKKESMELGTQIEVNSENGNVALESGFAVRRNSEENRANSGLKKAEDKAGYKS